MTSPVKPDKRDQERRALIYLAAEISGLTGFELELRRVIGNTNYNCLMGRLQEARDALRDDEDKLQTREQMLRGLDEEKRS